MFEIGLLHSLTTEKSIEVWLHLCPHQKCRLCEYENLMSLTPHPRLAPSPGVKQAVGIVP